MHFTRNLYFGFGRYCGNVFSEPAAFYVFWAPALVKNVFLKYFFSCWLSVNNSRNKMVYAFLLRFTVFETINFYIFFIKMIKLILLKIKNYKWLQKMRRQFCTSVSLETLHKISGQIIIAILLNITKRKIVKWKIRTKLKNNVNVQKQPLELL